MKTKVKGYMISRFNHSAGKVYETLYAATDSGAVYKTDERAFSIVFGGKRTQWNPASIDICEIKPDAGFEFIGNYEITI